MASRNSDDIVQILGDAIKELNETSRTSPWYPARAFCVHELLPEILEPKAADGQNPAIWREPTQAVMRFSKVGIEYYYYSPDGAWRPSKNPVDLEKLAIDHQDSLWGRQAFLMMTDLGWSHGACSEGPDQFREVIRHGEPFLKKYPESEVSNSVRLALADAYATWWNVSRLEPGEGTDPEPYEAGASEAKRKAINMYQEYLKAEMDPKGKIAKRLKALRDNPKGSETYEYFCDDYED